jgi:hypothetical protein
MAQNTLSILNLNLHRKSSNASLTLNEAQDQEAKSICSESESKEQAVSEINNLKYKIPLSTSSRVK